MAEPPADGPSTSTVLPSAPKECRTVAGGRPKFGEGREELAAGGYYEGHFRFGKREGVGVLVLNEEGTERYEGQFRAEVPDGQGRKVWPDGSVYDGQWRSGRKEGEGVLEEANGRRYSGQWKDGKRHGTGSQVLDAHTRYEGRWDNGMMHGSGKYYDTVAATVYEGRWHLGTHHGAGLLRGKDGRREKLTYNLGTLTHREILPPPVEYAHLPGI